MRASVAPIPQPTDAQLMTAFRSGDDASFDQLYQRYSPRVLSYAARMLGRREAAEDVCTETFVRLVDGRWRPSATGSLRGYLFTVAHRLCIDSLRARQRRTRFFALLRRASSAQATAEERLVIGQRDARLQSAIQRLAPAHRAVVLLTYTEGLTSPEVAQILGCTDQQVRSKLAYARRKLREELETTDDHR
ncbi:MAG: sigma-70 family RNA polymerase sigma factor [Myxococcales bacterium]|nr:sigma-70 family RNA polymerase sigma factor [Myxococcales bacterium]